MAICFGMFWCRFDKGYQWTTLHQYFNLMPFSDAIIIHSGALGHESPFESSVVSNGPLHLLRRDAWAGRGLTCGLPKDVSCKMRLIANCLVSPYPITSESMVEAEKGKVCL